MLSLLLNKMVIVCEPLIAIIDDQIAQLPKTIRAAHYRACASGIAEQIENSQLNIGMLLSACLSCHL
jgi:hypothetical protein